MNLFMLWMAGNGVQIFSLMITGMLMFNAIKAILSAQQGLLLYEAMKEDWFVGYTFGFLNLMLFIFIFLILLLMVSFFFLISVLIFYFLLFSPFLFDS